MEELPIQRYQVCKDGRCLSTTQVTAVVSQLVTPAKTAYMPMQRTAKAL